MELCERLCETCIKNGTNKCRGGYVIYEHGKNHTLSCTGYEEANIKEEFTKYDLEDRMVVEYRNGYRRMVVDDMLIGEDGCGYLSDYRNDLIAKSGFHNMDIVKVYDKIIVFSEIDHSTLIWQRKEPKEVTLKEIAERFGVDEVKIIDG